MVKKTLLASIVTLVIASFFTVIVFAASYYISEYGDDFTHLIPQSLNPCPSGWTCRDNNARKYHLVSGGGAWGVWWSAHAGTTAKRMDWYTFIPNDGTGTTWGAVQYWINNEYNSPSEAYSTIVVQSNWKEQAVYLGYLSRGDYRSHAQMENYCVYGYTCDTSYLVFWDRSQFNY